ncbi:MAG TPA: S41 family peptidase, partial [Cyclobacteriaceae bacterium]|nr:S41 family peptidase [Cyclobacteriaceae bacterium]
TVPNERYFDIARNLDIFATLFKEVNSFYVDSINPNDMMRTGIDAMLGSLDPYTNYIPEDEIEDYMTMTTNQYGGVGMLIGRSNDKNIVLMPYRGFPAFNSGLKIGDELIKVDDLDVTRMTTSDISRLLKGQSGTDVRVTIQRFNSKEPIEYTLKREKITIENVPYYGFASPEIGYLRLSDFTTSAGREVSRAVEKLKAEGAKKIILDLRDNPGGLLNEAVNVANVFISRGMDVVSTKGKVTEWNKTYKALNNAVDTEIPLVVLTNNRSASASEIVSGTIQDYDRGILVGKKTFGKGLVQTTRDLTYNSKLKVTTAKYYIPSGRCIQAINYGERNDDGSVKKIPDSLKVAFKTTNGRTVWDGGGVDPDLDVERKILAPITISLISKGLIFNYATEYFYRHETIPPSKEFTVSDEEFEKFIAWLNDKDYDYTTKVEQTIEELERLSKEERFNGEVGAEILDLKAKVRHNKENDLVKFRNEIRDILEDEIVTRYYLSDGTIESSFDDDPQIKAAVDILNNQEKYDSLLARN